MRSLLRAAAALILLAGAALPAAAQSAPHRQRFFIGFGFGGGGGEVSGNTDASGGTGWVTLGGTLSPKVRLAGDIQGFSPNDNSDFTMGTSTVAVLFYPSANGNFFLKGGVGAAEVSFKGPGPDGNGIGFGSVLGAGYDIMVGKRVSITPQFTIFGGQTGDVEDSDGNAIRNDVHFGIATLSVGIVFH
jgi:hypothetical protein